MPVRSGTSPEETYQLADLHKNRRPDSMDDSHDARAGRAGPRLAGEEYADDDVDAFIAENEGFRHAEGAYSFCRDAPNILTLSSGPKHPRARLIASFFLFGVLNNILYVIILSAALDLVPPSTPKGLVAFFNIFPSLTTKLLWPYLVPGRARYARRILVCTAASWLGMITIALVNSTPLRLLGISMASFSSGFGEMTFLQLSTTMPTPRHSRDALAAWSSGTGGAGISGAAVWWWMLRSLGVRGGLGLASFLPFAFPAVFFLLLPRLTRADGQEIGEDGDSIAGFHGTTSGQPIFAVDEDDVSVHSDAGHGARKVFISQTASVQVILTTQEKIALVKPMLLPYMLPLFLVYVFEYIINAVSLILPIT
jgi:battenin